MPNVANMAFLGALDFVIACMECALAPRVTSHPQPPGPAGFLAHKVATLHFRLAVPKKSSARQFHLANKVDLLKAALRVAYRWGQRQTCNLATMHTLRRP